MNDVTKIDSKYIYCMRFSDYYYHILFDTAVKIFTFTIKHILLFLYVQYVIRPV